MKFSKETFSRLDLANLLLNVHSYVHASGPQTEIEKQYAKWCGELAVERWRSDYMDYNFVMKSILYRNKNFIDLGKVLYVIYEAIIK